MELPTVAEAWNTYITLVKESGAHCAHETDRETGKKLTDAWQVYCRAFVADVTKW